MTIMAQKARAIKKCIDCEKEMPAAAFHLDQGQPDKLKKVCKLCAVEAAKRQRAVIREFCSLHGITKDDLINPALASSIMGISRDKVVAMCEENTLTSINVGTRDYDYWRISVRAAHEFANPKPKAIDKPEQLPLSTFEPKPAVTRKTAPPAEHRGAALMRQYIDEKGLMADFGVWVSENVFRP